MKRFTETQKWADPWFRSLKPETKLLWQWMLDNCDNAGVIEPDMGLATFQIGYPYPMNSLSELGERVVKLKSGKFFIPKFIEFQYGQLSEDCKAHNPVFISLRKHGIDRVAIGYGYPLSTSKGKGKGTREEFVEFAQEIEASKSDGDFLFDHFEENGWKRGKDPIKDWKAAMRKWKSAGWLPSQKNPTANGGSRPLSEPFKNCTPTGSRPLFD